MDSGQLHPTDTQGRTYVRHVDRGEANKPYLSPLAADIRRGIWKPRERGTRKSTSRTAAPTRTAVSFMVEAVADAAFLAAFWDRIVTILFK